MDARPKDLEYRATSVAAAVGSYAAHRLLERAKLNEWVEDLRAAIDVVGAVAAVLHRCVRKGAPAGASAAELGLHRDPHDHTVQKTIAKANGRLRALPGADTETRAARKAIVERFAWSNAWAIAHALRCEPTATIASLSAGQLSAGQLDTLGDDLHQMTEMLAGFARLESRERAHLRAGIPRRPPDLAARGLAAWAVEHNVGWAELAGVLFDLGERPDITKQIKASNLNGSNPADVRTVSVKLLADRLRQVKPNAGKGARGVNRKK